MRPLLLLLLSVLCCDAAGAAAAEAPPPARLVVIMSHTGTRLGWDGVHLAVDELNAQGGLLGRRIALTELDSKGSALHARAAALQAVQIAPFAVVGDRTSSLVMAVAPVLQAAGIPLLTPTATHDDLAKLGPYVFTQCPNDTAQGKALASFAWTELHARKIAVLINASQKYSESAAAGFAHAFRALGGKIVLEADYVQDATDFRAHLAKVKAARPDLLFLPGYATDVARIMRQGRELGIQAGFIGADGWGAGIYADAGPAVEGSHSLSCWHRELNEASRSFVQRYEKRFGPLTSGIEALAYEAVMSMAEAVKRANSLEPERVRAALAERRGHAKPVLVVRYSGRDSTVVRSIAAGDKP